MDLNEQDERNSCQNDNYITDQRASREVKQKAAKQIQKLSQPASKKPSCEQCPDSILTYESSVGAYVCESCGKVDDTVCFNYDAQEDSIFLRHGLKTAHFRDKGGAMPMLKSVQDKNPGQRMCSRILDIACSRYPIGKGGKQRVQALFDEEYPIIKNRSNEFKEAVILALIYKVALEMNPNVSVLDVIKSADCKRKLFHRALKYLKTRNLPFTPSSKNNKDISSSKQASLSSSALVRSVLKYASNKVLESSENFENFIRDTQAIFRLAENCWLSTGRSPSALIVACSFYAYKIYLVKHCKPDWKSIKFRQFCKLFGIAERKSAADRVSELKDVFSKLFEEYVKKNQHISTSHGFLPYIADIVLFSKTLMKSFWATFKCNSKESDISSVETEMSMTFKRSPTKQFKIEHPSTSKITEEQAIYLNSLDDEDIMAHEELDSYIKTPEEVQQTKEVKAKALVGESLYIEIGGGSAH